MMFPWVGCSLGQNYNREALQICTVAAMDTMSSQITNSEQFSSMDVEQDAKQLVKNQFQTESMKYLGSKKAWNFLVAISFSQRTVIPHSIYMKQFYITLTSLFSHQQYLVT